MTKKQRKEERKKERYRKTLNLVKSITSVYASKIPKKYINDLMGIGLISYNGTNHNWEIKTLMRQTISDLMFINRCVIPIAEIDHHIIFGVNKDGIKTQNID